MLEHREVMREEDEEKTLREEDDLIKDKKYLKSRILKEINSKRNDDKNKQVKF